jgi:hypothetical protein
MTPQSNRLPFLSFLAHDQKGTEESDCQTAGYHNDWKWHVGQKRRRSQCGCGCGCHAKIMMMDVVSLEK